MEATDLMTNVQLAQLIQKMHAEMNSRFEAAECRLNRIEAKLDQHEEYLAAIGLRFNQIDERLDKAIRPKRRATTYKQLILEALVQMGGAGTVGEVQKRVKQKRGEDFKPHTVTASRVDMVGEGLLQGDPKWWEITDKGRRFLQTHG